MQLSKHAIIPPHTGACAGTRASNAPPPDRHGRRRFDYLGGYPTKAAAQAALDQALGRHGDNVAPNPPSNTDTVVGGPASPTLNDLLDHWLTHLHTNKALRLRTIGRYRQLPAHHLRPYLGTVPVHALSTLQIQRHYDHLAHHGRKDGKTGGLGPRTIQEVHLCLRQALGYAMKWHDLPANPAADACELPRTGTCRSARQGAGWRSAGSRSASWLIHCRSGSLPSRAASTRALRSTDASG